MQHFSLSLPPPLSRILPLDPVVLDPRLLYCGCGHVGYCGPCHLVPLLGEFQLVCSGEEGSEEEGTGTQEYQSQPTTRYEDTNSKR